MSAYRYVVFPKGKQPTIHEVEELEGFAPLVEKKFAYGINKKDGGLAIAFEAAAFQKGIERDLGFEALIRRWEKRECEVVEHLSFVKDRAALKPIVSRAIHQTVGKHTALAAASGERHLTAKELAAKEALGRSGLEVHQTLQRHATFIRFASWMPHLLMGLGGVMIITVGFVVGNRMLSGNREHRKETIERIASDAMKESIDRRARIAAKETAPDEPTDDKVAEDEAAKDEETETPAAVEEENDVEDPARDLGNQVQP